MKSEDIKQALLEDNDFGHELRVGRIIKEIRQRQDDIFNPLTRIDIVEHGGTYTDRVSGKSRQFDYRCRMRRDRSNDGEDEGSLWMAVECKNLFERNPLVVCGRKRTRAEAFHTFVESPSWRPETATPYKDQLATKYVDGDFGLYPPREFVGKTLLRIRQVKEKNVAARFVTDPQGTDVYEKWSQALASSVDLAEGTGSPDNERFIRSFVLPIVVLPNDVLWRVAYDDSGSITEGPTKVEEVEYYVQHPIRVQGWRLVLTHVHFVTLNGFQGLLSRYINNERRHWQTTFFAEARRFEYWA